MSNQFLVPILFIIFNRQDTTQKVNSYNYVIQMLKAIDDFALIEEMWSVSKTYTHT